MVGPGERIVLAEDPEVDLNFLVDSFSLTISLRVVSGGQGKGVSKELSKFSCKEGCELGTPIRDNLVIESKPGVYLVIKEGGDICSSGGFCSGGENYPLCKAMVYHDQYRVKPRGGGKIGDEVTRDLLEGSRSRGWNGDKGWGGGMGVDLVLLANSTSLNVSSDEGG